MDVDFRIGTCSWADKSLLASNWYPQGCRGGRDRLRYYSTFFDTVEADSLFYALPSPSVIYSWVASTPPNFLFNAKAFALFTNHAVSAESLPSWCKSNLSEMTSQGAGRRVTLKDLDRKSRGRLFEEYKFLISILKSTQRLGYVLFQFSPSTRFDERWLTYMKRLRQLLPSYPIAIEVRHISWFDDDAKGKFLGLLEDENMAYVAVDEPRLRWTVPMNWHLTASWGTVVRFHGRNADGWRKGSSIHEKYRYKYNVDELNWWKDRALSMQLPKKVFMMFNNCYKDYAVQNAMMMKKLLGLNKDDVPLQMSLIDGLKKPEEGKGEEKGEFN